MLRKNYLSMVLLAMVGVVMSKMAMMTTGAAPESQPENTGTAPGSTTQGQPQAEPVFTLTQSALNAMLADQKRTLLTELGQLRDKASKWDKHEQEQMTEMEKLQNRIAELEPLATTAQQYEASIKVILEARLQGIPEQFRDLIPSGLTPAQQLEWIEKAQSKGMFTSAKPTPPNINAGEGAGTDGTQFSSELLETSQLTGIPVERLAAQQREIEKRRKQG